MEPRLDTGGVRVRVPDGYAATVAPTTGRRTRGAPVDGVDDPLQAALLAALEAQDLRVAEAVVVAPAGAVPAGPDEADGPRRRRTRGGDPEPASAGPAPAGGAVHLDLDVPAGEDAVVLLEQDGLYAWHLPTARDVAPAGPRRRGGPVPTRRLEFRFDVEAPSATLPETREVEAERRTRGLVADLVLKPVRAFVLRFVARKAVGNLARVLERHVAPGLLKMSSRPAAEWSRVETLADVGLPTDRPANVLLFVHGTFSSTAGGYGALAATPWGQAFLRAAEAHYDAVVGFDHASLSLDPHENAADLYDRLRAFDSPHPPTFDVVCHSRGGLVFRSLAELVLPGSGYAGRFDRAVFVACTNGGTALAEPDHWHELADLYTNLAVGAAKALSLFPQATAVATVLGELVKSLGALVRYLATEAVTERGIPGLAAMEPDGPFVRALNETQTGQATPDAVQYYVVRSTFRPRVAGGEHDPKELPRRLALAAA